MVVASVFLQKCLSSSFQNKFRLDFPFSVLSSLFSNPFAFDLNDMKRDDLLLDFSQNFFKLGAKDALSFSKQFCQSLSSWELEQSDHLMQLFANFSIFLSFLFYCFTINNKKQFLLPITHR